MHSNRSTYTLSEYQAKLRRNYLHLGVVLEKTAKGTFSIFRPLPKSPWLPESRSKYFKPLYTKAKLLKHSKKYTLCTLTYSTKLYTPESACHSVKHHIDLFFKRLGYRKSRPEYFLVCELTDQMMVHIHLVFDRFVHWKKVRASWYKVTGNIITDIRNKKRDQAIHYCFKYLTKAKKMPNGKWAFIFKHIDRIWSSSRNFFDDPEDQPKKYKFLFMLWNKDGILDEYFPNREILQNQGDLQECDVGLLEYDADHLDCVVSVGRFGMARQPAKLALAQPAQPLLGFYENSTWTY